MPLPLSAADERDELERREKHLLQPGDEIYCRRCCAWHPTWLEPTAQERWSGRS
jgi:hypothetical protein